MAESKRFTCQGEALAGCGSAKVVSASPLRVVIGAEEKAS
jgi:hypothetical protein